MKIATGVDLVYIPEFKELFEKNLLQKAFSNIELKNKKAEHAAGVFAAKEAVLKALDLKPGAWDKINISYKKTGKPKVKVETDIKIESIEISVTHIKDYAVATCVVLMT